MPNWAYTSYVVTGDENQLKSLYSTMKNLGKMKSPGLHENGFGSKWLGNLVIKLGGDWENIYCRGEWYNISLNIGILRFTVMSAWGELSETREFLEKVYPNLKFYYLTEESGMAIYQTNDKEGRYFPERYYLWTENTDSEYYETLQDVLKDVEKLTNHIGLENLEEAREALEEHSGDLCWTLEEIEVV